MRGAVRQRDTNAVVIKHTSWRFRTWTAPRQLRIPFVPTMAKTSSTPSVPQSKFRISTITGGANAHRVFISSSIAEQRWSTNDARFSIQRHRRLRPGGRVGLRERACEQEPVEGCDCSADARACSADGAVVDADGQRCYKFQSSTQSSQAEEQSRPRRHDFASVSNWEGFPTESPICGPDDGLSAGLDGITFPAWCRGSIKAYGNAIVPQVALRIFETINEYEGL